MIRSLVSLASMAVLAGAAHASVSVGQPAPDFTLTDSNGKTHQLSEFKGKTVVLEWHNPECPFVKKHYNAGNMQAQQVAAKGQDVVWLSINSGAPGKQGALDGGAVNSYLTDAKASPASYLLDPEGTVGKLYAAKTTPHMYVIDGAGTLQYVGAIDSTPSPDSADIPASTQYVSQALAELKAGKAVSVATTQPYGCSVKYAN
jgi:peroxiredoxin